ncbi:DUF1885 family protein [Bacillus sp. RAR_GA_16]|uniref:DUF1885 family protein n=1 Tax=Bacillus sp. RAR_GA_16 TaxID=2876774 RepID=UPI001CCE1756|nr:DUF1885 family protein [Bacillus sp. RAR_GA_16]MCA0174474.1 DUF1885 family protein [Bacillus sp. RAR_GA_16]
MPQSAYLTPTTGEDFSLNHVKSLLTYYMDITSKTGEQLSWSYGNFAFPYTLVEKTESDDWFYLKGKNDDFRTIVIGIANKTLQIVLPDHSTHGDKAKANELSKFLATKLKADLILFNGRKMLYTKK